MGLLLGPILEESVFRGCMLPVLTHTLGSAICRVSCSRRCHTLGMVYRYRCSIWFTALGIADNHGSRIHACDMQFDSSPLCQAVIALCGIAGGGQFQNKILESTEESAHRVSLASEEHSARLMSAFHKVSAAIGGMARH
jgi:hypothetical protein